MLAGPLPARSDDGEIVALGEGDADEMLALATLQQPGPFRRETRLMGRFVGAPALTLSLTR